MISIILPSHKEPGIAGVATEIEGLFPEAQIIVMSDRDGRGKGWAIRQGLNYVKGDIVVFLDGDGDIHPRMILRLLPFMESCEAVVGTKRICHKHLSRRIITHLSRIYIRVLFGLKCDTQTGIKMFRRRFIEDWESDGFLFDVEVLHSIKRRGGRIIEVPIEAEITKRMSGRALWKTLLESLTLKFRLLFPVRRWMNMSLDV